MRKKIHHSVHLPGQSFPNNYRLITCKLFSELVFLLRTKGLLALYFNRSKCTDKQELLWLGYRRGRTVLFKTANKETNMTSVMLKFTSCSFLCGSLVF